MNIAQLMEAVQAHSGSVQDMLELKSRLDEMGIRLENIYQEMEMRSSYVDCHRDISSARELVQPHSHSFYEMILCCSCDRVQYLLGTQRYLLQKGDVLFIPPGISHAPLFPEEMHRPYERIVYWVNAELVTQFRQRWPEVTRIDSRWDGAFLLRTASTLWEADIAEAFQRGQQESSNRFPGWEAALYGNATMLIIQLNRALLSSQKQPASEGSELLDELLEYVETHLREKISIGTAARHLLVSESTVTHLCRRRLGIGFYQYVTQQRLVVAKKWMQEPLTLAEIGEKAGFCDYSSFYRAFMQEYGISPRQYRILQESGGKLPL